MGGLWRTLALFLSLSGPLWASTDVDLRPDVSRAILEVRVVRVYDGDTIEVDLGPDHPEILWENIRLSRYERVRLLGIDTPELSTDPAEYYAREAKSLLLRLVAHRIVRLEVVPDNERDGYGRLLAYVYVKKRGEWIFVNGELVRQGAADLLFVGTERYAGYLRELWIEAVANRRGMWGRYPGTITVEEIYADPLKYSLEGVTVSAVLESVEVKWDGVYLRCRGPFTFFIPKERQRLFGSLLEAISPGTEILASGVLEWTPTGPVVELWGPMQVRSPEVSMDADP